MLTSISVDEVLVGVCTITCVECDENYTGEFTRLIKNVFTNISEKSTLVMTEIRL